MSNPFIIEFEEALPFFSVPGPSPTGPRCTIWEGIAPGPFPTPVPNPVSSIRTDQNWGVRFQWETQGALNYLLAGTWELVVYLEQMGGAEFSLPANTRAEPFVSAPNIYSVNMQFNPGVVPVGAYRIVTTVTMMGPTGFRGPIAGVGDGPVVNFYKTGT